MCIIWKGSLFIVCSWGRESSQEEKLLIHCLVVPKVWVSNGGWCQKHCWASFICYHVITCHQAAYYLEHYPSRRYMYPSNQRRVELPGSSNRLCPVMTPITSHFLCSLLPPCLRTSSLQAPLTSCLICSLTEKPSQNVLSAWQMRVINCDQNTLQSLQIRTELLLFKVKNA